MILLCRRSLLALAAVADIAIHARPQPVAAKALAAGSICRRAISKLCCRRWCAPIS